MINKDKILELAHRQGKITTRDFLVKFDVSRQYINQLMSELISEKRMVKIGGTRSAFYVSVSYAKEHPEIIPDVFRKKYRNVELEEHKVLIEAEEKLSRIAELPENIRSIFTFAFSEMLNNAIEHSQSKLIQVEVSVRDNKLSFIVEDSGIGAFRNIMKKRSSPL